MHIGKYITLLFGVAATQGMTEEDTEMDSPTMNNGVPVLLDSSAKRIQVNLGRNTLRMYDRDALPEVSRTSHSFRKAGRSILSRPNSLKALRDDIEIEIDLLRKIIRKFKMLSSEDWRLKLMPEAEAAVKAAKTNLARFQEVAQRFQYSEALYSIVNIEKSLESLQKAITKAERYLPLHSQEFAEPQTLDHELQFYRKNLNTVIGMVARRMRQGLVEDFHIWPEITFLNNAHYKLESIQHNLLLSIRTANDKQQEAVGAAEKLLKEIQNEMERIEGAVSTHDTFLQAQKMEEWRRYQEELRRRKLSSK